MSDKVIDQFADLCDAFQNMRIEMHKSPKYAGKVAATDKFYESIRLFAYEIGLAPPYMPLPPADEYLP